MNYADPTKKDFSDVCSVVALSKCYDIKATLMTEDTHHRSSGHHPSGPNKS